MLVVVSLINLRLLSERCRNSGGSGGLIDIYTLFLFVYLTAVEVCAHIRQLLDSRIKPHWERERRTPVEVFAVVAAA